MLKQSNGAKQLATYLGVCLLLTLMLLKPPLTTSAQSSSLTLAIDSVFTGQYPGALVYVTVRDANGVPVTGLTEANFEINEDRTPKAIPVESVETQINADTGIWVVMAIDVSGSMASKPLDDAKAAARKFLDTMTGNDHVAVYVFSDSANLDAVDPAHETSFTTDKQSLYSFVDSLQAGGKTPLYDAAYKSVLMIADVPAAEPRAILLFTDGRDEGSQKASVDTAATEAQRRAIPVFTIGLGDADTDFIKELSRRTGGEYQSADDSAALAGLFEGVAARLKTQYVLNYVSLLPGDGQPHRITVTVKLNGAFASAEADTDPLPLIPTETPVSTPTMPPTPTTLPVPPSATPTAVPEAPSPVGPVVIGGGAVAGLLLFAGFLYAVLRTRGQSVGSKK